jgi:transcriptional regulator with XRE-family HTH domain
MKRRGVTVENLCENIGMSRSAFYRKCRGTSEFTLTEIQKIVENLGLDSPMGIFFTEKVS